ncbi:hypothetical protein KTJ89_11190 [Brevibacterium sediminis]|uniref:hypothetical protein n=1 Tax=Brevibacterium sediminis TaxID=1857024 RepID=UPI0021751176|nr:hypothetical protein [Brevibacterium sediminis]MCS4593545.1 hypothetical protein [Brevibacterium sediminis]
MRKTIVPIVAIAALVLAGCGPDPSGGSYNDVEALRDAFVKAGGECEEWKQTDKVLGAAQSGECGTNTVLSTYLTHDAVQDRIASTKDSIFGAMGDDWLTGENWIINGGNIDELQKKMGGQIVSFEDGEED